jgi:hypothetical protein
MKIAIITSIFGTNQNLHPPAVSFDSADYYAFVDRHHDCNVWKQIQSVPFSLDEKYKGRRDAKIYKILPHLFLPDYDYWIWVDPTHEPIMDPLKICANLGENDIGLFKHPHRVCAFEEASEVIKLGYDDPALISNQLSYYKSCGFPKNHGLYELPAFVRKNTLNVQELNLKWWELTCKYSSRDQIGLPFILWKMGTIPHMFEGYANNGLKQNPYLPQVRWKSQL